MSLYKILGVSQDASLDDLKQAYRKLAMQHHPDRGGDKIEFTQIAAAYSILSNPDKRAYYDKHGDTENEQDVIESRAMHGLVIYLTKLIKDAGVNAVHIRYIPTLRDLIHVDRAKYVSTKRSVSEYINRVLVIMKRLKRKKGFDFIQMSLRSEIADLENFRVLTEDNVSVCDRMLELLATYDESFDIISMLQKGVSTDG